MPHICKHLAIILLFTSAGCQPNSSPQTKNDTSGNYSLTLEDGIYVEVFDSTNVDENRYTLNNQIFTEGTHFIYEFYHLTADGKKLSFKHDPDVEDYTKAWQFLDIDSEDEKKIERVDISVKPGLQPFIQSIPDYNQSIVKYDYLIGEQKASFNSMSGVIENEKNIWIHPPRDKYFRILELNPFPFIQAPYEIGNTWTWELSIGSSWGDERWQTWEGTIKNSYQYEITDKRVITSALGEIECFEIISTASNRLGSSELTSLFSPVYGFISLNYLNIDSSKTILTLVDTNMKPNNAN